ncbi:MAG: diaminopimelate epimerase [Bacteroidetes bacterium 4572_77]|nr:MAG: diaminopimelate epimerase [Bacteroidetes bacterium 4572_77]
MILEFYKYHGAGNDFIILDNRQESLELSSKQIAFLCHRHKGIGADGLMLLESSTSSDFYMKYYNSDGQKGSMCGNGGRCIIAFAHDRGLIQEYYYFEASDGLHNAQILNSYENEKIVKLKMTDVQISKQNSKHLIIDTGSPHYINFEENTKQLDVKTLGKKIRENKKISADGVNVNYILENKNQLFVRTFERGVEDETLACGTGVTAAAIASGIRQKLIYNEFDIETLGGKLKVSFTSLDGENFKNIFLTGPAAFVFKGQIKL